MMISEAQDRQQWDDFLSSQPYSPFLQSWTMGDVYKETGQEPVRLIATDGQNITGVCQAIVVPARRGRHLSVSYGPVATTEDVMMQFVEELKKRAKDLHCSFIRISPFLPSDHPQTQSLYQITKPSPLHLLAEHIWYLPLITSDPWTQTASGTSRSEEEILAGMRKNTRNLVRRAEKEGVTIETSQNPDEDVNEFIRLHDETRKRHGFTPYTNAFFRAQVKHFAKRGECTLYLAKYQNEIIASSIHMHAFGETSYHHGASTHKYDKIPASYLLQWTAIRDALKREDHIYNFWGIAPEGVKNHPFKGVTLFKTGFGGALLNIAHCMDVPVSARYYGTRAFELLRKWRRGF